MQKQPNIILITTDQQRFDTLPPYAPSFLRTPHINHLMRDGVTFDKAYSCSPICVAARASIITGKFPRTTKILANQNTSLTIGHKNTLPSCLRECGYQTAAIGKMHFGPERVRHGFDEMIIPSDYYIEMNKNGYPLKPMQHGLGQNELYPGMATVPENMTLTNWIANQCVSYIRDRRDPSLPFFLWCSFSKPHPPLDPPEPYYSMYRNCPIPKPIFGDWSENDVPIPMKRHRESWSEDIIPPEIIREARAAYYGLITQIDYNIGRIFAALQDFKMFNETLIIFTSDHGDFLGDHHTGSKQFFHDPSARIPFIIRFPKSWQNRRFGERLDHLVTHADIMPTLIAAAGGKIPEDCEGENIIDYLNGKLKNPRKYLEATIGDVLCEKPYVNYLGITDGTFKYIWYPEGPSEQLFDLKNDPKELKNIAKLKKYSETKKVLKSELIRREKARGGLFLSSDGNLIALPPLNDSEKERRSKPWPGYHTEYFQVDVRH
ncbi:MAG TPA: sulfatase-like hydrolase/transferase [Victivallales bacterium]|nr:sulfatase-like hydrolase/transferase [Victivallales bacterium]HPO89524.1 sulfatase-like hydrolase/transferase [Victivallales bacterium]HRR28670.1 sulfatase-like hydrolase/transferase [Victivallales bacterium]